MRSRLPFNCGISVSIWTLGGLACVSATLACYYLVIVYGPTPVRSRICCVKSGRKNKSGGKAQHSKEVLNFGVRRFHAAFVS
jgi:hypothetical protein